MTHHSECRFAARGLFCLQSLVHVFACGSVISCEEREVRASTPRHCHCIDGRGGVVFSKRRACVLVLGASDVCFVCAPKGGPVRTMGVPAIISPCSAQPKSFHSAHAVADLKIRSSERSRTDCRCLATGEWQRRAESSASRRLWVTPQCAPAPLCSHPNAHLCANHTASRTCTHFLHPICFCSGSHEGQKLEKREGWECWRHLHHLDTTLMPPLAFVCLVSGKESWIGFWRCLLLRE